MSEELKILSTAGAPVRGVPVAVARTTVAPDADLDVPREMGGTGGPGANPEQFFAVGYAARFKSAHIGIAPLRTGGCGLRAALDLDAHAPASGSLRTTAP